MQSALDEQEAMLALEKSLTKEQLDWALSSMRAHGWDGEAPAWCWRMAFYEAQQKFPKKDTP